MKVNYPFPKNVIKETEEKKITTTKISTHGMLFENELNSSNDYYKTKGMALIYKKPTPIQVVRVDYPSRSKAKIVEGYYKTPSTTDYNGIYRGKYIDYEAKETNNLSFDFKHIFPHQVEHLKKVDDMGGIAFVIIYFKKIQEIYIIDIKDFYTLYSLGKTTGRRSIKIETIKEIGVKVERGFAPPINYLKGVDEKYFK